MEFLEDGPRAGEAGTCLVWTLDGRQRLGQVELGAGALPPGSDAMELDACPAERVDGRIQIRTSPRRATLETQRVRRGAPAIHPAAPPAPPRGEAPAPRPNARPSRRHHSVMQAGARPPGGTTRPRNHGRRAVLRRNALAASSSACHGRPGIGFLRDLIVAWVAAGSIRPSASSVPRESPRSRCMSGRHHPGRRRKPGRPSSSRPGSTSWRARRRPGTRPTGRARSARGCATQGNAPRRRADLDGAPKALVCERQRVGVAAPLNAPHAAIAWTSSMSRMSSSRGTSASRLPVEHVERLVVAPAVRVRSDPVKRRGFEVGPLQRLGDLDRFVAPRPRCLELAPGRPGRRRQVASPPSS